MQHALSYGAGIKAEQVAHVRERERPLAIVALHPRTRVQIVPMLAPATTVGPRCGSANGSFEYGEDEAHLGGKVPSGCVGTV